LRVSGRVENAGLRPAFMDYRALSARYERLIEQFRTGRHVHAYLLAGPQGIGKRTFARYLSSVLLCESDNKPCCVCSQCAQIHDGKHSSVTEVSPEGGKAIPIDRIRELVSLSSMHSLDGRERIILIEPMESLTPQAQNCLLKSLEEPVTNVIYFLLSHDPSSLLDTILSRCLVFKLAPWPSGVLTTYLLGLGFPGDKVERAAALSGGNVGEALSMLAETDDDGAEAALAQILGMQNARDAVRCSAMLKDRAGSGDSILLLLEQVLQQGMLIKSGLLHKQLLDNTPFGAVMQSASLQELAVLTEQVIRARKLKMSNVNWQSNVDQLIYKLLEAKGTWQKS
jgi:DNA polymerase III subunit delta'